MSLTEFDGKTVIVTGGALGMGRATALAFAAAGARVVIADWNHADGEDLARLIDAGGGSARFVKTDVSREDDVKAVVSAAEVAFGPLCVMVNNAGVLGERKLLVDQTEADLDKVLGVNLKGVVFGMKHALLAMAPRRAGVIVNFTSVQGFRVCYPGSSAYAASKAAVVALTKAGALEAGPHGIRVVGIAPGPIDTPMLRAAAGNDWPPAITQDVPLRRIGEAEEIANAVLWLASGQAAYVSGAILPVDGGFLAP